MFLLKVVWFLLPAGFANMSPILAKKLWPRWDTPVDLNRTWRGREILGTHKTYRGLFVGSITGMAVFYLQQGFFREFIFIRDLSAFDYRAVSVFFGAWMGLSGLLGDLIKSFIKRRLGISAGQSWIPFDQIDWIIGVLFGVSILFIPDTAFIIASLIIGVALHFLTKVVGYFLHLNEAPL